MLRATASAGAYVQGIGATVTGVPGVAGNLPNGDAVSSATSPTSLGNVFYATGTAGAESGCDPLTVGQKFTRWKAGISLGSYASVTTNLAGSIGDVSAYAQTSGNANAAFVCDTIEQVRASSNGSDFGVFGYGVGNQAYVTVLGGSVADHYIDYLLVPNAAYFASVADSLVAEEDITFARLPETITSDFHHVAEFQLTAYRYPDFNNDGHLDYGDLQVLENAFNTAGGFDAGDINGDGLIDKQDLITLYADPYLSLTPTQQQQADAFYAANAPEPASIALAIVPIFLLQRQAGRRGRGQGRG